VTVEPGAIPPDAMEMEAAPGKPIKSIGNRICPQILTVANNLAVQPETVGLNSARQTLPA